jgi:hypothetical protein
MWVRDPTKIMSFKLTGQEYFILARRIEALDIPREKQIALIKMVNSEDDEMGTLGVKMLHKYEKNNDKKMY